MANKTTKDHGEIRRWAEERGGKPSHVKDTGSTEDIGILRIDFPDYSGQSSLETVTWEAWFDKFDERNLALLYQDETAEGQIVTSETPREAETGAGRGTRASRGGSRAKKAPIKKAAAKKGAAKKAAAKKGIKRSASARKKATKKKAANRPAKRHAARRTSRSRTAAAKRTAAKRPSASRSSRKRSAAKKSSTKKRR